MNALNSLVLLAGYSLKTDSHLICQFCLCHVLLTAQCRNRSSDIQILWQKSVNSRILDTLPSGWYDKPNLNERGKESCI